jgi:hypothetical protein
MKSVCAAARACGGPGARRTRCPATNARGEPVRATATCTCGTRCAAGSWVPGRVCRGLVLRRLSSLPESLDRAGMPALPLPATPPSRRDPGTGASPSSAVVRLHLMEVPRVATTGVRSTTTVPRAGAFERASTEPAQCRPPRTSHQLLASQRRDPNPRARPAEVGFTCNHSIEDDRILNPTHKRGPLSTPCAQRLLRNRRRPVSRETRPMLGK